MSEIPTELLDAYHRTTYSVFVRDAAGDRQITLHIGERSAELDSLMDQYSVDCCAYLTAFNPGSSLQEAEVNASRQAELLSQLDSESYTVFSGHSIADADDWPVEEAALALGIELGRAKALAVEFGQIGFLYSERGERVRLILCHDDSL